MFRKVILFFLMGFAFLQADPLDKCNDAAVVSKLKKQIPNEILKIYTNYLELRLKGLNMKSIRKYLKS